MKARALTDTYLKSLKPAPKGTRVSIADRECPGMKIRITDTGHASFILWRRMPGSANPVARVIGEYGQISLADARLVAREWIAQIKGGRDPAHVAAEKAEAERLATAAERAKAEMTLGKTWESYQLHIAHQRQAKKVARIVKLNLLPFWENTPMHRLTRKDVRGRIKEIAKRAISQGFSTFAIVKPLFNFWRDETDFEGAVPTDGMTARKIIGRSPKRRQRVLDDLEIFAFWRATEPRYWRYYVEKEQRLIRGNLQSVSTIHSDRKVMVLGCRMLFLSGARLNEIFEADRSEISHDGQVLAVPEQRFKSGATHFIQLSAKAQAVIADLPRRNSGTLLFSDDGKQPSRPW